MTIGSFTINAFGDSNLAGATALYWEPDPGLPDVVNRALKGLFPNPPRRGGASSPGRTLGNLLRTSWDRKQLFGVYEKAYNRMMWSVGWGTGSRFKAGSYLQVRGYIRAAALAAIRRHPVLYAKFVWVNLVEFYRGVGYSFDIQSSLAYRESGEYVHADVSTQGAAVPGPAKLDTRWPGRAISFVQHAWQGLQNAVFQEQFWTWAYFAMLILSAGQLARYRGRHFGAALLLALALIPLGASLVVCLVQIAMDEVQLPDPVRLLPGGGAGSASAAQAPRPDPAAASGSAPPGDPDDRGEAALDVGVGRGPGRDADPHRGPRLPAP